MDTWCVDAEIPLLQHEKPKIVGKGKMKTTSKGSIVMLNEGLAYFMPYDSFTFLELVTTIALRHKPQSYNVKAYKEQKKGQEESDYLSNTFLDYSPSSIVNALVILDYFSFYVKK